MTELLRIAGQRKTDHFMARSSVVSMSRFVTPGEFICNQLIAQHNETNIGGGPKAGTSAVHHNLLS
jgi:hypothetical protein